MGPRFANRGYRPVVFADEVGEVFLQWVHGSRTVVIDQPGMLLDGVKLPSMGPRFANRGYR